MKTYIAKIGGIGILIAMALSLEGAYCTAGAVPEPPSSGTASNGCSYEWNNGYCAVSCSKRVATDCSGPASSATVCAQDAEACYPGSAGL